MLLASFEIFGKAVPLARARFSRGHAYTPLKSRNYEQRVKLLAKKAMGLNKPTSAPIAIVLEEIRQHKVKRGWCDKRPDLDNIVKALLDGMNGVVYRDDGQVAIIKAAKRYVNKGERPRVIVKIFSLDNQLSLEMLK